MKKMTILDIMNEVAKGEELGHVYTEFKRVSEKEARHNDTTSYSNGDYGIEWNVNGTIVRMGEDDYFMIKNRFYKGL